MRSERPGEIIVAVLLAGLLLGGRGLAQTGRDNSSAPERNQAALQAGNEPGARRETALIRLEELLEKAGQSGDARLQCRVLLSLAELFWKTDQARARLRFEQAWQVAARTPDNPKQTGAGFDWRSSRRQLRQMILEAVFNCDPQLAREWAEALMSESRRAGTADETSAARALWLDVATRMAADESVPFGEWPAIAVFPPRPAAAEGTLLLAISGLLAAPNQGLNDGLQANPLTQAEIDRLNSLIHAWQAQPQSPRIKPPNDFANDLAENRALADPLQRTLALVMQARTLRARKADEQAAAILVELEAWLMAADDGEGKMRALLALAEEEMTPNPEHTGELIRAAFDAGRRMADSDVWLAASTAVLTKLAETDFNRAWALMGAIENLPHEIELKLAVCLAAAK